MKFEELLLAATATDDFNGRMPVRALYKPTVSGNVRGRHEEVTLSHRMGEGRGEGVLCSASRGLLRTATAHGLFVSTVEINGQS